MSRTLQIIISLAAVALATPDGAALAGPARGDDQADERRQVMTKKRTKLRRRRGERSRVVARVEAETKLRVVARRGRWLRVRHGRKVGWVTRTSVRAIERAPARGEAERCEERTPTAWSHSVRAPDVPKVIVQASAARAFAQPSGEARAVFEVDEGAELEVLANGGDRWYLVDSGSGKVGWIPRAAVRDKGFQNLRKAGTEEGSGEPGVARVASDPAPRARSTRLRADAAGGLLASGARLSAAEGSYLATTYAPATAVSAGLDFVPGSFRVGAEARYLFATGAPGYDVAGADGNIEGIGFYRHEATAAATVGYGRDLVVTGRGGYHYEILSIEPRDGGAPIVGETLQGPIAGVGVALPGAGERLALRGTVDLLVLPRREAESGGELDGGVAAWGTLAAVYQLSGRFGLAASYRYARSQREAGADPEAERVDESHLVLVGVGLGR